MPEKVKPARSHSLEVDQNHRPRVSRADCFSWRLSTHIKALKRYPFETHGKKTKKKTSYRAKAQTSQKKQQKFRAKAKANLKRIKRNSPEEVKNQHVKEFEGHRQHQKDHQKSKESISKGPKAFPKSPVNTTQKKLGETCNGSENPEQLP